LPVLLSKLQNITQSNLQKKFDQGAIAPKKKEINGGKKIIRKYI
jgi:hypothetical protein